MEYGQSIDEIHYMKPNETIRLEHHMIRGSVVSNAPIIVSYKLGTITLVPQDNQYKDEKNKVVVSYLYEI